MVRMRIVGIVGLLTLELHGEAIVKFTFRAYLAQYLEALHNRDRAENLLTVL
ncbi:hypothetical protein D3C81_1853740 [compost metagenome]